MIIYGGLQAELIGTKYNGRIHRYGFPIFGNIVFIYISRPTYNDEYFGNCKIWKDAICIFQIENMTFVISVAFLASSIIDQYTEVKWLVHFDEVMLQSRTPLQNIPSIDSLMHAWIKHCFFVSYVFTTMQSLG